MNTENKKYSPQRLKDYVLWYYFRYYPSNAKVLQKLKEKGREEDALKIFSEIEHLFQEEEVIKAKIDNYMFRNKNFRYIENKMREKLFPKEKVDLYLEKFKESGESILDEIFLRKKIENYIQKGKSRSYIFYTLSETKADKQKLEILLEEFFPEGESENILREYEKLKEKFPRDKITQKLITKGFRYDDIKRSLDV